MANSGPQRSQRTQRKPGNDPTTQTIISAAIEVHRTLGPGLLEAVYEEALCVEFELHGIPFERQVAKTVFYKGRPIKEQRIDLLIDKEVVVEIKAVSTLPDIATSQVLSYLKSTGLKKALLINFNSPRLVDGVTRLSL